MLSLKKKPSSCDVGDPVSSKRSATDQSGGLWTHPDRARGRHYEPRGTVQEGRLACSRRSGNPDRFAAIQDGADVLQPPIRCLARQNMVKLERLHRRERCLRGFLSHHSAVFQVSEQVQISPCAGALFASRSEHRRAKTVAPLIPREDRKRGQEPRDRYADRVSDEDQARARRLRRLLGGPASRLLTPRVSVAPISSGRGDPRIFLDERRLHVLGE